MGGEEVGELLASAVGEAGHQEDRGHAFLDEAVMVGAGEQALLRQRVLGERDPHVAAGPGDRLAHRRMLGAEGDDVGEIVEQDRHVEIDDGRDLAAAATGWRARYWAPSRPSSSAVTAANRIERFGRSGEVGHRPGDLQHGRDADGIVHRAVVDPVAFSRRP